MDHTAVLPGSPFAAGATDFVRSSSVDLPSLAESVRSVEERIARQNAEYEALTRAHERTREAETTAVARAHALAVDLASVRSALESEQTRSREMDRVLTERSAAMEAARVRAEDALRESDRHQGESLTLRDSLAARESTIAQVLHSLGERDAQLAALQSEHAKIVPVLEATSKSTSQLEAELQSSRAQVNALGQDLKAGRDAAAALNLEFKRSESQVSAARSELAIARPRPLPTWSCGPANGAAGSIKTCSVRWTRRSAPQTPDTAHSNRSAAACTAGWSNWKRNWRRNWLLRKPSGPT